MKKNLILIALLAFSLFQISCREEQTKKEALIEEMKEEGATMKEKKDEDSYKLKMETEDGKEVKIKEEDGTTKIKVDDDSK